MLNQIDDDLSGSDDESVDFSLEASKIDEYRNNIATNPMDYDSHVNLINGLHFLINLEEARDARKTMNKYYPLSPSLWTQWVKDEKELGSDSEFICDLFSKGTNEYASVDLWIGYIEYAIENNFNKIKIREIYDKAINSIGFNFIFGKQLWQIIRFYEKNFVLNNMQTLNDHTVSDIKEQLQLIKKLYELQLSVPMIGNDEIMTEFEEFCAEHNYPVDEIKRKYEENENKLNEILAFEENLSLAEAEINKEKAWLSYLKFIETNFDKVYVVQCYERAVTDICLSGNLWIQYLRFIERHFAGNTDSIIKTYKRAVLNCDRSLYIWLGLVRNMEKYMFSIEEIRETFNSIFGHQITENNSFLCIWQAYLDFEKRILDKEILRNPGIIPDMTVIRALFERLITIENYLDYDPNCSLIKYWAFIEAKFGNNIEKSRELWTLVRKSLGKYATVIIENLEFERRFGDFDSLKRLANSALNNNIDSQDFMFDKILRITAEDGDLESYLHFLKKIEIQKQKNIPKEEIKNKVESRISNKRKADNQFPTTKSKIQKTSHEPVKEVPTTSKGDDEETREYNDENTLFVSNLDFKVTEDQIKEKFTTVVGEVKSIRLIKDAGGKSRGFAYVEFDNAEMCEKGLTLEHGLLNNRPMFVNRSNPSQRHKFVYSVGKTEANKLFIKNLPRTVTRYALEEIFKKYGKLIEVRIPTFKNGAPKSIAFVEFDNANSASKALINTDGLMIGDKKIEVLISRTPEKSKVKDNQEKQVGQSDGNKSEIGSEKVAFKPKDVFVAPKPMMMPRKIIHQRHGGESGENEIEQKKSNDDFRKFLK